VKQYLGQLISDGRPVLEDAEVWLGEWDSGWSAAVLVPDARTGAELLAAHSAYELRLEDGRTGECLATGYTHHIGGGTLALRGYGPLAPTT
jgi:hypothetical protein